MVAVQQRILDWPNIFERNLKEKYQKMRIAVAKEVILYVLTVKRIIVQISISIMMIVVRMVFVQKMYKSMINYHMVR